MLHCPREYEKQKDDDEEQDDDQNEEGTTDIHYTETYNRKTIHTEAYWVNFERNTNSSGRRFRPTGVSTIEELILIRHRSKEKRKGRRKVKRDTPEAKAKDKARHNGPEAMAKAKARRDEPEAMAKVCWLVYLIGEERRMPNIRLLSSYWTPVCSVTADGDAYDFKEERMLVVDRAEVALIHPGGKYDSPYRRITSPVAQ